MNELEEFLTEKSKGEPPSSSKLWELDHETMRLILDSPVNHTQVADFLREKRGIEIASSTLGKFRKNWSDDPRVDAYYEAREDV